MYVQDNPVKVKDDLSVDVMVEWECGTKFLLQFNDLHALYGWPKYGKTKLSRKRPMFITIGEKPTYFFSDNAAAWDELRYKILVNTCHPRGQVTDNSQYMNYCRTQVLLGAIPTGTRAQLADHLLGIELERSYGNLGT
ncbi:hypothetical protein VPHD520_0108 [Vibrio phage D520]